MVLQPVDGIEAVLALIIPRCVEVHQLAAIGFGGIGGAHRRAPLHHQALLHTERMASEDLVGEHGVLAIGVPASEHIVLVVEVLTVVDAVLIAAHVHPQTRNADPVPLAKIERC